MAGGRVHLTRKAFDLLATLVEHAPMVVTKDELHRRLWPDAFVTDATVAGVVKELRRALDDRESDEPLIRTAHGVGYASRAPSSVTTPIRPRRRSVAWWKARDVCCSAKARTR